MMNPFVCCPKNAVKVWDHMTDDFLPCFTSAKDALSDLYGVLQLRKQLEDQCFPSVLLIKKLTMTLQELGNSLKLIDLKF